MSIKQKELWDILQSLIESQKDTDRKFQETSLKFQETDRKFQEISLKFQETDRRFQETDRRFQETDRRFQETDRRFQETDRRFQETDRKFQETDHRFQETDRKFQETDHRFQETDRKFQETDRKFQETDRKLKEVVNQLGRLGNRLGDFVEEMVRPALVHLFQERKINVHQVLQNLTAYDNSRRMQSQVDLVVLNTTEAVVVECKSQLSIDDVNDHLNRLEQFKINFSQYATFRILGAVAAMVVPENVGQYAIRKGLFLLVPSGETMVIRNDEYFEPKLW